MHYCGKCGARVSDAAVFCTECGNRLRTAEDVGGQEFYYVPNSDSRDSRQSDSGRYDNSSKIVLAIVAAFIAVAIIAVFVFFTAYIPAVRNKLYDTSKHTEQQMTAYDGDAGNVAAEDIQQTVTLTVNKYYNDLSFDDTDAEAIAVNPMISQCTDEVRVDDFAFGITVIPKYLNSTIEIFKLSSDRSSTSQISVYSKSFTTDTQINIYCTMPETYAAYKIIVTYPTGTKGEYNISANMVDFNDVQYIYSPENRHTVATEAEAINIVKQYIASGKADYGAYSDIGVNARDALYIVDAQPMGQPEGISMRFIVYRNGGAVLYMGVGSEWEDMNASVRTRLGLLNSKKVETLEEAISIVRDYYRTYTSYDPPYYEDYGSDQSKWIIRAYEYMTYPDPSENHQSTFNIFSIDKETGAVYDEILMHPVIDDEGNYVDWIYH